MSNGSIRWFSGKLPKSRSALAIVAAFMVLAVFAVVPAFAVHDTGRFQLDGDASTGLNTTSAPTATDDWDKVCNQATGGNASCHTSANSVSGNTTGATAVSWTG